MSKKRLETKVLKFKPLKDKEGRYIPYCDYHWHRGISRTPEICEQRRCKHYQKLYIQKRS